MATSVNSRQIRDQNVKEEDIQTGAVSRDKVNVTDAAKALIRKVTFASQQFNSNWNGATAGTGDGTISAKDDYFVALSKSYKYYLKAYFSTFVVIYPNLETDLVFDSIDFSWDNGSTRYDNTSGVLSIEQSELWNIQVQVTVEPNGTGTAVGPWGIFLVDTVSGDVICSTSSEGATEIETLHLNTIHYAASASSLKVVMECSDRTDIKLFNRFGKDYATQLNAIRIR